MTIIRIRSAEFASAARTAFYPAELDAPPWHVVEMCRAIEFAGRQLLVMRDEGEYLVCVDRATNEVVRVIEWEA